MLIENSSFNFPGETHRKIRWWTCWITAMPSHYSINKTPWLAMLWSTIHPRSQLTKDTSNPEVKKMTTIRVTCYWTLIIMKTTNLTWEENGNNAFAKSCCYSLREFEMPQFNKTAWTHGDNNVSTLQSTRPNLTMTYRTARIYHCRMHGPIVRRIQQYFLFQSDSQKTVTFRIPNIMKWSSITNRIFLIRWFLNWQIRENLEKRPQIDRKIKIPDVPWISILPISPFAMVNYAKQRAQI